VLRNSLLACDNKQMGAARFSASFDLFARYRTSHKAGTQVQPLTTLPHTAASAGAGWARQSDTRANTCAHARQHKKLLPAADGSLPSPSVANRRLRWLLSSSVSELTGLALASTAGLMDSLPVIKSGEEMANRVSKRHEQQAMESKSHPKPSTAASAGAGWVRQLRRVTAHANTCATHGSNQDHTSFHQQLGQDTHP
jgi:hypothetical protein